MTPERSYVISAARSIYLDTSAVRRIGARLGATPRARECYTSALTILELLADIQRNEREFRLRRSAIEGIMAGGIEIDWQLPDTRLYCAFEVLRSSYDIYETRVQDLEVVLECLAVSNTLAEFKVRAVERGLDAAITRLAAIDDEISQSHIDAFGRWAQHNREQFRASDTPAFLRELGLPEDYSLTQMARALAGSEFDIQLGLYAITRQLTISRQQDSAFHDKLFRSYDHSMDLFLRAESQQIWREIGFAYSPGRNTGADLAHLKYVVPEVFVVSTDSAMQAQVVSAGGAVLSLAELVAA